MPSTHIDSFQHIRNQLTRALLGGCGTTLMLLLLLLSLASGPVQAEEPKESTKLILLVKAATNVNPTESGRTSPIRVRIYELKEAVAFTEADYFSLDTADKITLGADLLAKDDFILRPGESRLIERKSSTQTVSLGILAAYQDLANSAWRVIYKLPEAPEAAWYRFAIPSNKVDLIIELKAQGIALSEKP